MCYNFLNAYWGGKNGVCYSSLISTKNTSDPPKVSLAFYLHWDTVLLTEAQWLTQRRSVKWAGWAGDGCGCPRRQWWGHGAVSSISEVPAEPDMTHTTVARGKRICFRLGLHHQQQQGYINPGTVGALTAQRSWQLGLPCVSKNTQGTDERFKNTVSLVLMMKKLRFKIPFAWWSYDSNFHRKFLPTVIHAQGGPYITLCPLHN